jgi:beta-barrel assembly-enhancing protease
LWEIKFANVVIKNQGYSFFPINLSVNNNNNGVKVMRHYFMGILLAGLFAAITAHADSQYHQSRIIDANRVEASYNADAQLVTLPDVNEYLAKMVDKIIAEEASAKGFFRIHALRNSLPYIYCLDNGAIYISTGLIARLQNEAQLAGLLAPEMASIFRQDADSKNDLIEKRNEPKRMLPNLLAVVFTGGMAAIPIISSQEKETKALNSKLQKETDHLALQWMVAASFDIFQSAAATKRLAQTLAEEKRSGETALSNLTQLEERGQQLTNASEKLTNKELKALDEKYFKSMIHKFGLDLARSDKRGSNAERFNTVLTRVESESEKDGETMFLRAEYAREFATSDMQLSEATHVYEEAIKYKNAPAETWRELGLLYRKFEKNEAARKNLTAYLQQKPNAADAPIIKMYLETL